MDPGEDIYADLDNIGVEDGMSQDSSQNVRKNINLRLTRSSSNSKGRKGRRGSPRGGRKSDVKDEEEMEHDHQSAENYEEMQLPVMKGPPEPRHKSQKLRWDHKVNLIGDKVIDPVIHCCEHCKLPILLYGRLIPCKHVFCYVCAQLLTRDKKCPRCDGKVSRVEKTALGTVFVCSFGGSKHGWTGCRRTYLSPRDLQAHIEHRHRNTAKPVPAPPPTQQPPAIAVPQSFAAVQVPPSLHPATGPPVQAPAVGTPVDYGNPSTGPPPASQPPVVVYQQPPPQIGPMQTFQHPPPVQPQQPGIPTSFAQMPPKSTIESYHSIPVMSTARTNLITVPIQDESPDFRRPPPTGPMSQVPMSQAPPMSQAQMSQPPPNFYSNQPPIQMGGPNNGPFTQLPPSNISHPRGPMPVQGGPRLGSVPPGSVAPLNRQPPPQQRYPSPHRPYDDNNQVFNNPSGAPPRQWIPNSQPPQRGPPPQQGPPPTGSAPRPYYQ